MNEVYDEYEEYEKHLIHDKRLHIDMAKRWHEVDDGIENFVTKHGTSALSFFLGAMAAVCFAVGIYLPFTGKIVLIILGHLLVIVAFVLALLAHRANKVFKRKLAESIFFSFCFPQMIKDVVLDEKEREITQTKYKVRNLVLDIQWFTEHISECDPNDKDKYLDILKHLTFLTEKLNSITSSELTHNYDRLSKDLQDSWPIMEAVDKTYQKNQS